jgi:hypothetical protein
MSMHARFRQHFPFAAIALTAGGLLIGDGSVSILLLAASIALLPVAYAHDVDDIAQATREGRFDADHDHGAPQGPTYNRSDACTSAPARAPLARTPMHRSRSR